MRSIVGACGTGKTHLMRGLTADCVRAGWRAVVVDLHADDDWAAPGVTVERIATPLGLPAALRDRKPRVLTVAMPRRAEPNLDPFADAVLNAPYTVLVVPEAYRWMPEGRPLTPAVRDLVHTWRHGKVGLFLDFQGFRDVRKEVLDACRWLYAFPASNPRDRNRYRELGGPALVAAVDECAARFARTTPESEGWHVRINVNAPPQAKYEPTRRTTL